MLAILLTLVHVIVCFFLIIVVLLQSGKAADLAGAFGGMGSQTTFGPRGSATVLSKATTIAAVLFMITSMWLSILATRHSGSVSSVLDKAGKPKAAVPVTPALPRPVAPTSAPNVTPQVQVKQPGQAPVNAPTPVQAVPVPRNANQPNPAKVLKPAGAPGPNSGGPAAVPPKPAPTQPQSTAPAAQPAAQQPSPTQK